jgi:hypothetical protein
MLQLFILFFSFFFLLSCNPTEVEETDGMVFLSQVFEYVYAPGQHAPSALPSDIQYVIGDPELHEAWLYLGGFGGYVVAGFPRDILNEEGPDFEVFALKGAAPEPAIVYVMADENANGLPDDTWYELLGNLAEHSQRNYNVTYYKAENANIHWKDSNGQTGELQSYFGGAVSAHWWWPHTLSDSITFFGTRLPDVYENHPVNGIDYWLVPPGLLEWGYAENNHGNDYDSRRGSNSLDIGNAVDSAGNPVHLYSIRFIKIQTAVLQQAGQINEVSAEIRGARSLR